MKKSIIKLSYRHIIDSSSATQFEKNIFAATYNEFLLKSQAYNLEEKFTSFSEMCANDGRANSLHYKIGLVIGPFISSLQNKMPSCTDNLNNEILFENVSTKLIESDIKNASQHKLALIFTTGIITLAGSFGEYLLLTYGDKRNDAEIETFLLHLKENISIISYCE